jgi:SAM-dependent methyltransferase
MDVNPVARAFDATADEYERGRPSWPADAIAELLERFGATEVLDLAAGTGKLTRVLAAHADEVIAVEPLGEMRRILQDRVPQARALAGTAEAIPLADASVDAVFVAEAFHWFDLPRAVAEIARVLRPGGHLVVVWNRPATDLDWFGDLWDAIKQHHPGEHDVDRAPWRETIEADERFAPLEDEEAFHEHSTDRESQLALITSFSWIGSLPDDERGAALARARAVLERHGIDRVTVPYRTQISIARRA